MLLQLFSLLKHEWNLSSELNNSTCLANVLTKNSYQVRSTAIHANPLYYLKGDMLRRLHERVCLRALQPAGNERYPLKQRVHGEQDQLGNGRW